MLPRVRWSRDLTNHQFRKIRQRLGLTQAQLADFLGYGHAIRVSEFERETNPRPVPHHVALLMEAYAEGYRPKNWPAGRPKG
jgi:transcriptional regulator with XRE-family HTH domain